MVERPIAVDLFAGVGGFSLGFEQAGFDIKLAVEIDPVHAAVHKYNFPACAVIPRSITELTGGELRTRSGIGDRPIDLVCGGAPCQGYSLIGKRALDDPRNYLVKDFFRIVIELQPAYFVFENVKGFTLGRHKYFLEELIAAFESYGYSIRKPWKVLNAAHYGVPQKRERLFLLGSKKGLPLPQYPKPLTKLSSNCCDRLVDLPLTPTCKEALDDLPELESFEDLLYGDCVETATWGQLSSYGQRIRCLSDDSWYFAYKRRWNPNLLTSSRRTNHSANSRNRFQATAAGKIEPISRFFKLHPDRVANTLRAGTDAKRGAHTSPRPIHYSSPRCISVREMARLHGFWDCFQFHATKWHGARQIGNSVPPPVARAIGVEIMKCLDITPSIPNDVLDLGDRKLLTMNMKQAAKYWQILCNY
ncbi:DNA cytosine methyltransferase [Myxosarcina sp. GI1]|uniref:DNA cytosine methyltransferase n=1 Tax=Myxosarcina sp. GI1 TaxID=1541065 RepID=UPI00056481AE|nr:DNA cytosine methyltransferase [Myxosarcina sp. GI1]